MNIQINILIVVLLNTTRNFYSVIICISYATYLFLLHLLNILNSTIWQKSLPVQSLPEWSELLLLLSFIVLFLSLNGYPTTNIHPVLSTYIVEPTTRLTVCLITIPRRRVELVRSIYSLASER